MHANSTAGRIAAKAGVSRYKAEQAIAVGKHAPELAEKVVKGEMPLRDAAKVAQKRKPKATIRRAGKRQPQAEKRRMIDGLSAMRGASRGLSECDVKLLMIALNDEEVREWAAIAQEISRKLRDFAHRLKNALQKAC